MERHPRYFSRFHYLGTAATDCSGVLPWIAHRCMPNVLRSCEKHLTANPGHVDTWAATAANTQIWTERELGKNGIIPPNLSLMTHDTGLTEGQLRAWVTSAESYQDGSGYRVLFRPDTPKAILALMPRISSAGMLVVAYEKYAMSYKRTQLAATA